MSDSAASSSRYRSVLDLVSTIALVAASGAVIWAVWLRPVPEVTQAAAGRPAPVLPEAPISLEGSALKGDSNSRVGIIEFSEFQCPFCARFAQDTLPALVKKYVDTGQALFAFRHLPLESIHPHAMLAGEIATCAQTHGLFWNVHDVFFQSPPSKTAEEFRARSLKAGMNDAVLNGCLAGGTATAAVKADLALAARIKVQTTPAFIIGPLVDGRVKATHMVMGARPLSAFEEAIDAALTQVGKQARR